MAEKVRLGGMALVNGVLVHGPHAWACAVRTDDGELKVAAEYKRLRAAEVENPILRGPARLAEVFALLPQVYRRLPEARLPFQRPQVLAAMVGDRARGQGDQGLAAPEPARAASSSAGCSRCCRRRSRCAAPSSRPTTAPSTSRSAATSTASSAHASTSAAARTCSARCSRARRSGRRSPRKAPAHLRGPARAAAQLGAVAASTELFGWMTRNPDNALSRALAWPGHELQHRFATAEPTPEQLEVAEAALARACLRTLEARCSAAP